MDRMEHYEAEMLMNNMIYSNKDEWERARLLMYASLKPYLKNGSMTPQELLPLATDEDAKEIYEEEKPSYRDYEEMKKMTNEFANKLKENKGQE
jgi:hypothetical protein